MKVLWVKSGPTFRGSKYANILLLKRLGNITVCQEEVEVGFGERLADLCHTNSHIEPEVEQERDTRFSTLISVLTYIFISHPLSFSHMLKIKPFVLKSKEKKVVLCVKTLNLQSDSFYETHYILNENHPWAGNSY